MSSFQKNSLGWQWRKLQQRFYEWLTLKDPNNTDTDTDTSSWFDSPIWEILAKGIFWLVVVSLSVWVLWVLWQLLEPYLYTAFKSPGQSQQTRGKIIKEVSASIWVARAKKAQERGNYREACICLYMAMLQRLDETGIAPHQPSRTDGEYLQIVGELPKPEPYQILLATHQALCFGNTEPTRSLFQQCQNAYDRVEY
ncbi:DUF4129 domain-containing protein [Spirulina sp. 06S082]|uniref:DUF4129 domain-containing protein n=1 Tax=Spirulina sp. 06S082 TaxID=3110248 RepID=UPI002B1EF87A|nr:DUF4129 domain-containing protein [Spirulina sp. 06S082]MEA5468624.1 DUF4129 domain-containing protein [Spirulina sp. 06S082]